MTIKYIPFESRTGFKSPGFEVTPLGDITANSLKISITQELDVPSLKIAGIDIINNDDSSFSLGDSIINSSLQRLGTLEYLNIEGDLMMTKGSSWTVSVVDGKITLLSGPEVGTLDNIDIGSTAPALGTFTDVVSDTLLTDTLDVTGVSTLNSLYVNYDVLVVGTLEVTDITINNQPTEIYHATRKDYVDNTASAFAIAFGA
jgi:hypothetical protein